MVIPVSLVFLVHCSPTTYMCAELLPVSARWDAGSVYMFSDISNLSKEGFNNKHTEQGLVTLRGGIT